MKQFSEMTFIFYHRSYLHYRTAPLKNDWTHPSYNLNHHCTLEIKYSFMLKLFLVKCKVLYVWYDYLNDFAARWTNVFCMIYMDLHNQCRSLLDSLFHPNKYLQVFWYQWSRYLKLNLDLSFIQITMLSVSEIWDTFAQFAFSYSIKDSYDRYHKY